MPLFRTCIQTPITSPKPQPWPSNPHLDYVSSLHLALPSLPQSVLHFTVRWSLFRSITQQSRLLNDLLLHYPLPRDRLCNLPSSPLPQLAHIRRPWLSVAWRWLIWQIPGCAEGRYLSSSRGTGKKKQTDSVSKLSVMFFHQELVKVGLCHRVTSI